MDKRLRALVEAIYLSVSIACMLAILITMILIVQRGEKVCLYEANPAISIIEICLVAPALIYTCHKFVKALIAIRGRIKHE